MVVLAKCKRVNRFKVLPDHNLLGMGKPGFHHLGGSVGGKAGFANYGCEVHGLIF